MSTEREPALRAEGLVVAYPGGEPVLRALDLALRPGELVCVLGANGAGKSCLLKTLGGLIPPRAGRVQVLGLELAHMGARRRARAIASVPQSLRALPDVLVETFLLGGRYPHRRLLAQPDRGDREAVRRALEEADAADFAGRSLHELSGGQMQRVLLARALAQEAGVLLFDEPTASLDPEHQVGVFGSLARLVADPARERAALVATHELNLASRFATRILLLGGGGVLGEGSPLEVLRPERLEPVYGPDLLFLEAPAGRGAPAAPVVVPWPRRPPGGGG